MSNFININNTLLNLESVSNVNIQRKRNRVIFNLNYTIGVPKSSKEDQSKRISDYVYWDFSNNLELVNSVENLLNHNYIKENFIILGNSWINKNEISTVKFDQNKLRFIFNLSNSATFVDRKGDIRLTSEFVYVDFDDYNEFEVNMKYVATILGVF